MAGNTDSYLTLKGKLDFPPGVLVIGSHMQVDSRKEKVIFFLAPPFSFVFNHTFFLLEFTARIDLFANFLVLKVGKWLFGCQLPPLLVQ